MSFVLTAGRLIVIIYTLRSLFLYLTAPAIFVLHIEQVETERSRVSRHTSTSWEEDTEMKELEYATWFLII